MNDISKQLLFQHTDVFSAQTGTRYLADHLIPASDAAPRRGRLRSANRNCLTVPRCWLSTYGCRAFDNAGPTVWNSLPDKT